MASTRRKPKSPKTPAHQEPCDSVIKLAKRVEVLERDYHGLKASMSTISGEMSSLRAAVHQVDARSIRGEQLMMWLQRDQRRLTRVLEAVAGALKVPLPPPTSDEPTAGD